MKEKNAAHTLCKWKEMFEMFKHEKQIKVKTKCCLQASKIFLLWLLNQTASDKRVRDRASKAKNRDEKTRMKF